MTNQERAFEAEWKDRDQLYDFPQVKEVVRAWHAKGWSRERPKAKPLEREYIITAIIPNGFACQDNGSPNMALHEWLIANAIPEGTKIRVTVEEA